MHWLSEEAFRPLVYCPVCRGSRERVVHLEGPKHTHAIAVCNYCGGNGKIPAGWEGR